jgi:eukaryotic-like serine/threonine-protein kinase
MPRHFSSDEWRVILGLARDAGGLAKPDRAVFLESQSTDPEVITEALKLADQFDLQPDEPLGAERTTIGRFQLLDYLGSGSSGQVYSAVDPELRRSVAVKIFRTNAAGSLSAEERFIREARAASALNHPNIVTVYEIVRSDTHVAVVMELVPGSPLRILCGTQASPETVLAIARQIAEALAAAHSSGIVHRDIKPENIMVQPDGRVKVLDFGLARRAGDSTITVLTIPGGIPGGTLRYMSPEHFRSQPITVKSDIFALGLVLCELASGQHPFAQGGSDSNSYLNPIDILHAIGTAELPLNLNFDPRFPPSFEKTVRAMLAKDPAERPNAVEVAAVFEGLVPLSGRSPARHFPKRILWRWAVAAIVLFATTSAGVLRYRHATAPPQFVPTLCLTHLVPENHATAAAISHDGKFISYANVDGIFVQSLKSSELTTLKQPHEFIVDQIAWSPDGTKLIASGFSAVTAAPAVWSVPTNGKPAQELRADARLAVPSADGAHIAFVSGDYNSVETMDVDGQDAERIWTAPPEDSIHFLLWLPDGRHLILQRRHTSLNHTPVHLKEGVEWSLDVFDLNQKTITDTRINEPNSELPSIVGLRPDKVVLDTSPEPNSRTIEQLSSIRVDSAGRYIDRQMQPLSGHLQFGIGMSIRLTASDDGQKVAILKHAVVESVFVADFHRATLQFSNFHRLTLATNPSYPHTWTPDSRQVIFESNREGTWGLYQQSVDRRLPEPIRNNSVRSELLPQLTPDRKYILFVSAPFGTSRPFTLMRIPVGGGATEEVPIGGPVDEFRCSLSPNGRCVLRKTLGAKEFVYFELDPIRGIGPELARTAWIPSSLLGDWDISPDGQSLALPSHDLRSAKVRLIRLSRLKTNPREQEVVLPQLTQIASIAWTADGTGWFVSIHTGIGRRMYFADLQGRITPLADISGWAVPSPDGRKVAFLNEIVDANVWLLSIK